MFIINDLQQRTSSFFSNQRRLSNRSNIGPSSVSKNYYKKQRNASENYLLKPNDIVIARTGGTIGKTFLVKETPVKSLFASYLIRVIPSMDLVADFLKLFMESPIYWKQLQDAAWGAGQPNVNGTSLSKIIIPLPPKFEQVRIVAKLERVMKACTELQQSIQVSREQNELLLQQVLKETLTL